MGKNLVDIAKGIYEPKKSGGSKGSLWYVWFLVICGVLWLILK